MINNLLIVQCKWEQSLKGSQGFTWVCVFVKTDQMVSLEFVHFTVCESYKKKPVNEYWILVDGIYVEAFKMKYTDIYNLLWNI